MREMKKVVKSLVVSCVFHFPYPFQSLPSFIHSKMEATLKSHWKIHKKGSGDLRSIFQRLISFACSSVLWLSFFRWALWDVRERWGKKRWETSRHPIKVRVCPIENSIAWKFLCECFLFLFNYDGNFFSTFYWWVFEYE